MCTVIGCLAKERLEISTLSVAFPAIVSNCVANMSKAVNNPLPWDWLCSERHLIHNVVTSLFAVLKNDEHNPIQIEARECKQELDRWEVWIIVSQCIKFFLMIDEDLKFGIRYLQWLLYRARSFLSKIPSAGGYLDSSRTISHPGQFKNYLEEDSPEEEKVQ